MATKLPSSKLTGENHKDIDGVATQIKTICNRWNHATWPNSIANSPLGGACSKGSRWRRQ